MNKLLNGTRFWVILILVAGVVTAAAVPWSESKPSKPLPENTTAASSVAPDRAMAANTNWSKAILSVSNLSCGGCIANIKTSLAPLPGIGKISVDITTEAADIYFDPDKLKAPQQIADAITAAGYPAKIKRVVDPDQVRSEKRQMARYSNQYIASVGQLKIPRHDFDMELSHARKRYQELYGPSVFNDTRGAGVLDQLKTQIASRLISDSIKLQELVI